VGTSYGTLADESINSDEAGDVMLEALGFPRFLKKSNGPAVEPESDTLFAPATPKLTIVENTLTAASPNTSDRSVLPRTIFLPP
jgi:hypothetical protein